MIPFCECGRGKESFGGMCQTCLVETHGQEKVDRVNQIFRDSLLEILSPKEEQSCE